MCSGRVLLKCRSKSGTFNQHPFIDWVSGTLGSPVETRGTRITFERTSGSSSLLLKAQIRFTNPSIPKEKVSTFPGLLQAQGKRGFFYKEFEEPESIQVLTNLLSKYGSLRGEDVTSSFIRPVDELKNEEVLVEFGSPNIAKPLHMGHMRSHVTGNFCQGICRTLGHPVKSLCFLGDWGTQFGILQAGLKKDYKDGNAVEKLSLNDLLQVYVKSVQEGETNEDFFKEALRLSSLLEKGDEECVKMWKVIREKTLSHLEGFWSLLGIKYNIIEGESDFVVGNSWIEKVIKDLQSLGLLEVAPDGCVYCVLPPDEKFSKEMKIPLIKKDGASLYLLRDIACALSRQERLSFNRLIYVVDKGQAHHFLALFRILEAIGIQENKYSTSSWEKKLSLLSFGKVEGMSTRSGNFVLLSDVIDVGTSIMQESRLKSPNVRNKDDSSNIARELAISALVVNYLKIRRNKDVSFNWDEALRPIGETGVNLQYNHARLASLEKNVRERQPHLLLQVEEGFDIEELLKDDPLALDLAVQLINFEDAMWSSYSELEPCILLSYLFRLSDKVSKSLKHLKVLQEPSLSGNDKVAAARLSLFLLARRILSIGLKTVGITPLDEI